MGKAIIEYAGYRAPQTTNWDKVIGDVGEDITGVLTKREKQREEDFKIQQDTESAINDFSTGVSQDFSDYVSRGVEANRDVMMKYTKMLRNNDINSTQYKRLMNRVNSDWQQFGQFSKDFETRLADMEKRRQAIPPESSSIETWNSERIASAADFKNKQLVPNASSGGLYSISYDADGKPKKTEIIHMNELNNFRGQLVNRVNLQDQIKNITDKAGNFKSVIATGNIKTAEGLSKRLAEEDPELLTEYNNLIEGVYNSVLTGPPNQIASALADNSLNSKGQEYFIYKEGDLAQGGKFEGRDAENGIKMVQETDGTWGGSLTDNQKELLKKKSKEIADVQLGFEETYTRDYEKEQEERLKNKLEETKIKADTELKKASVVGYWRKKLKEAEKKKTGTELNPYTEVMSMFEDQDASRIKGNKNVEQAGFNENGELEVKMKGQDGVKTYSTDTNEGQISIARLLYPDDPEKLVDEQFYRDKKSYKGETSEIKGEEVIVIGADDLNQEVDGSDYTFEKFINDDWGDDADKKVGYLKEVAFQTGILNESDVNNLDIEVVKKGSDDDFMKITYTMSDGRVIESETLDNDPAWTKGDVDEENQKVFENFLQELRTELYFKGDETQSETDVDENL